MFATLLSEIGDASRIFFLRKPAHPETVYSPPLLRALMAISLIAGGLFYFLTRHDTLPSGALIMRAWSWSAALALVVIVFYARKDATGRLWRRLTLVIAIGFVASMTFGVAATIAILHFASSPVSTLPVGYAVMIGWPLWTFLAARQAFRDEAATRSPGFHAAKFCVIACVAVFGIPFAGFCDDASQSRLLKRNQPLTAEQKQAAEATWRRLGETRSANEAAQPARLKAALDALPPRDPKGVNIFALGIAGSDEDDVFVKENARALAILGERFHFGRRALTLANNIDPDNVSPAANIQNIAGALGALKQRMDIDKDILVLSMTSHGSPDGFQLQGADYDRVLSPQRLKSMLDDAGVKNRVIIVSACSSGIFVPVLANDHTAVITASAKDRASFGCESGSDWTYFGDAFFAHGLSDASTLVGAFEKARRRVAEWEAEQNFTPSQPQMFVGKEIAREFPQIVGATAAINTDGRSVDRQLRNMPVRAPLRSAQRL